MRKLVRIIIALAVLVVLLNLPIVKTMLGINEPGDLKYSNYDGSFTFEEVNNQHRDLEMCLAKFNEFKKVNSADTILYRLQEKNYLKVWNYGEYLFGQRFKLDYISLHEVYTRRGKLDHKSGFQDF
jgi:hypothetical protein